MSACAGKHTSSRIDFNPDWTFIKCDAEWPVEFDSEERVMEAVILPHTWNALDMGPGQLDPYIGSGWYKKEFFAPELKAGQRLLIEFEGVNNCHKVWINGGYAGGRNGGFLASMIDVTDLLVDGQNTILVRVDNSYDIKAGMPQWIGWNRYGGITQPVWLHIRKHAYIDCAGVEIRTPEVSRDSAITVVKSHIAETNYKGSDLEVRHILYSPEGQQICTASTSLKTAFLINTVEMKLPALSNPRLWSDRSPSLYLLKTQLLEDGMVIDSRENRIGYRFFDFDANAGFSLNGKPTQLRGVNIHMFFPGLGNALPERFYREDMKLIKQMGCNYMRSSHYPRTKEVLDACDELGIMVMEEQPFWHGSVRASGGEEAIRTAVRLVKDMVRQHGSHPSIIAWNTVNEIMIAPPYKPGYGYFSPDDPEREAWKLKPEEYPYMRRHLQEMVKAFKEADPDRPVSMVVGGQWEKNDRAGLTSVTDLVAYNGGAMYLDDEFIGPGTGKTYEFRPDYYRELFPERIHIMSEGILNHFPYARADWEKEKEGWRWSAKYWNMINQRPWFCGGSMWCFTDYSYLSPMVVDRFTDDSGISHHDLHGAVDRYRLPKEIFYFYEAMWADHPVLHILGHWNHPAGSTQDVVIFTNCRDVELRLNGKSLGKGITSSEEYPAIENPPLIWKNVPFQKGKLEAIGKYDDQQLTDSRTSSGDPVKIILSASNDINADGRDISFIDAMICDKSGKRCYTVSASLSLTVTGAARIAGDSQIDVSGGLARVAIRSSGETGEVRLIAEGEDLRRGELVLGSKLK
jgi:beta-galactosidase